MSDFFQYSPVARAKNGQVLFTYGSLDTLEEAVKQFDIWKDNYHYDIIEARVDITNHGEKVKTVNYTQKWVAEGETEVRPQEPYPEFIGRRLRDIILEKLPAVATDICHGGVAGCPSDYSYFNRTYDCTPDHAAHDNCSHESCTACWNQVYVGKDKKGNW